MKTIAASLAGIRDRIGPTPRAIRFRPMAVWNAGCGVLRWEQERARAGILAMVAAMLLLPSSARAEPSAASPDPTMADPTMVEATQVGATQETQTVPNEAGEGPSMSRSEFWIELESPSEGELLRSGVGLIELRGRVGTGFRGAHDVVIALDGSQSSLLPSGLDLDEDGTLGELRYPARGRGGTKGPFRRWTTDFDDVVGAGEVSAAKRVLERLDPERARVGLIRFSGGSRVVVPMGRVSEARAALDDWSLLEDWTGSSLASGVLGGLKLLRDLDESSDDPSRSVDASGLGGDEAVAERTKAVVLIASDGLATAAMQPRTGATMRSEHTEQRMAAREAIRAAERADREGVSIYAVEVQNEEDEDPRLLEQMTQMTGGRYVYAREPAALAMELPNPSYVTLKGVKIRNLTATEEARAVRVFSNGEFDAFVSLKEGTNQIRVRAELPSGEVLSLVRSIRYERPERPYASDTDRVAALRDALRKRTEETRALPPREIRPASPGQRSVRVQVPNQFREREEAP